MISNIKLVIIHTHPIQYNSPFFRQLSNQIRIKVLYTWKQTQKGYFDSKFKKQIKWDIPLLDGYEYEFVKNISPLPKTNNLIGTINPGILKKIRKFNPDAILIYGWKNLSHLYSMTHFQNKIPILFRGDSTLLDSRNSLKDKIRIKFLKQIYSFIDYALYVGTENKKYFKAVGLKEEQLVFVPHAVENERFFDTNGYYEKKAQEWKKELGLKPENLIFLYAGKFEPKKNVAFLVKAFFKNSNSDHRLIIVGNGPLEEEIKKIAKSDNRIIFLPFQNQSRMPVVYRLADVFVLPSAWGETWGLSINEAMASGRAILASNKVGCATDLVIPEENGYIFSYNSEEDLTNKMLKINKSTAQKFGNKSKEIIQKWSYQNGINNLLDLLNEIKTSSFADRY